MSENFFRACAGVILFSAVAVSVYHRHKADKSSGEAIPRSADGTAMMLVIRIAGVLLWLTPLVYLINPSWMAWSKIGLPDWVRCGGIALGVLCVLGVYSLFSSIGSGISPTSATRADHRLVVHGPYRWIRHPLYTFGSALFVLFGVTADIWIVAVLGVFAFIVMAIRTPKEEANLIGKFGDEYREYMKRTGRFLPKLRRTR